MRGAYGAKEAHARGGDGMLRALIVCRHAEMRDTLLCFYAADDCHSCRRLIADIDV